MRLEMYKCVTLNVHLVLFTMMIFQNFLLVSSIKNPRFIDRKEFEVVEVLNYCWLNIFAALQMMQFSAKNITPEWKDQVMGKERCLWFFQIDAKPP